jgi:hypothetical protein
MDFLKKIGQKIGKEDEIARKAYGEAFDKANPLERAAMRGNVGSIFSFEPGSPGSEQDLDSFVRIKPGQPSLANPMQAYSSLYNMYGGRKMRGLLFD